MYRIILMCGLFGAVFSQVVLPGKCERPQTAQANLDIFEILGTYYQVHRIPNDNEQGDCSITTFGIDGFAGFIFNSERLPNGTMHTWRGAVKPADKNAFRITYDSGDYTYYTLATDSETYMIVYNCQDIPNADEKNVFAWVLSRNKTLSEAGVQGVSHVYRSNPELQLATWQNTNQDNC